MDNKFVFVFHCKEVLEDVSSSRIYVNSLWDIEMGRKGKKGAY